MLVPEVFLFLGTLMVIGSLVALWVAQSIRSWFFAEGQFEAQPYRPGKVSQ